MTVKVVKDNVKAFTALTKMLTRTAVLVGIPESANARDDGKIGNATIGYLNETGSPSQNIPPRPHLVPGVEEAKGAIVKQMERAGRAALDGNSAGITAAMNGAGLAAQNAVQAKITAGPFVPLADKTTAKRRAKGRTGTKPLLDTGECRRSITYVIRGPDASS